RPAASPRKGPDSPDWNRRGLFARRPENGARRGVRLRGAPADGGRGDHFPLRAGRRGPPGRSDSPARPPHRGRGLKRSGKLSPPIRAIFLDVDGVLTDGLLYIDDRG